MNGTWSNLVHIWCAKWAKADWVRNDALTLLQGNAGILTPKYAVMFPLNVVQGGAMM